MTRWIFTLVASRKFDCFQENKYHLKARDLHLVALFGWLLDGLKSTFKHLNTAAGEPLKLAASQNPLNAVNFNAVHSLMRARCSKSGTANVFPTKSVHFLFLFPPSTFEHRSAKKKKKNDEFPSYANHCSTLMFASVLTAARAVFRVK